MSIMKYCAKLLAVVKCDHITRPQIQKPLLIQLTTGTGCKRLTQGTQNMYVCTDRKIAQ